MSSYPFLADEVERTINQRIRESEVKTKDQLRALTDYQLAYMNTNHEDFIGFNKLATFLFVQKNMLHLRVLTQKFLIFYWNSNWSDNDTSLFISN